MSTCALRTDFLFYGGFATPGQSSNLDETVSPYMDALVDFRESVRKAALDKDDKLIQTVLHECDRVRDEALIDIGVRLEDRTGTKAVWKVQRQTHTHTSTLSLSLLFFQSSDYLARSINE